MRYNADTVHHAKDWPTMVFENDLGWSRILSRPLSGDTIWQRIHQAWDVLRGRCDVLEWTDQ